MTWKFLYVTGLKAQLALPRVSFTKLCHSRLIDTIKGQVSLIYEAGILWCKSYTVWTKRISDLLYGHCLCVVFACVLVEGLFHFHKRGYVMSLFGIHLFYTWLAMTPHRRQGSNEVQASFTALTHQGSQGCSATTTDRNTNGFTFMHTRNHTDR